MKNQFLKKTMALALAGAMTLSMAACGKDDAGNGSQSDSQQSEQQESSAESSEETPAENSEDSGEEAPEEGGQAEAPQIEDTTINIRVMNEFRNLDKVLAPAGELHPPLAPSPDHQGTAQGLLQGLQVPAHRRLGDVQRLGRGGHAAQPGHRQKDLDPLLRHTIPSRYNSQVIL